VQKSILLAAIQNEIQRPDFSYFVDEPLSVAQGGRGGVVAGCTACKKRINTMQQFLECRLYREIVGTLNLVNPLLRIYSWGNGHGDSPKIPASKDALRLLQWPRLICRSHLETRATIMRLLFFPIAPSPIAPNPFSP